VAAAPPRPDAERRALLRSALAAAGGLAAGVAGAQPTAPTRTRSAGAVPGAAPARGLALALGSGALHGHAHVGVMRVFEARGVKPDLIVGTSVGAIVGALWAAGLDAAAVERAAERFGLFDAAQLAWPSRGLLRNDGLQRALRELLPTPSIEAWPVAFAAVATDLATGERVIVDTGDGPSAVAASACMPVLFEPVERGGRRLVDGALVEPVPVRAARALGGGRVVGVDIAFRPHDEPVRGIVDVGFQTVHILVNALIAEQIGEADVQVRLELHGLMRGRRDYAELLVQAGERAATKAWPQIAG
jgi:NTE family protein